MNSVVIIPAYNPPNKFPKLIHYIKNKLFLDIIIIDDGSKPPIKLLNSENIYLLINKTNKGKGYALIKAFKFAIEKGFTHAITLDADFQHDPKYINEFISINENIKIVYGKRNFSKTMPVHRRLSNFLTSYIISLICNVKIHDTQCGYRRYKLDEMQSYKFSQNGFQFETEVLFKIVKNPNSITHIEIPTIYNNSNSSIRIIKDTLKFINFVIKFLIIRK